MFVIQLTITSKRDSVSGFGVKFTFSSGQGFSFSSLLWLQHWSFRVPAPPVVQHFESLGPNLLCMGQNRCIVSKQIIPGEGTVMWCYVAALLNSVLQSAMLPSCRQWTSSQIFFKSNFIIKTPCLNPWTVVFFSEATWRIICHCHTLSTTLPIKHH